MLKKKYPLPKKKAARTPPLSESPTCQRSPFASQFTPRAGLSSRGDTRVSPRACALETPSRRRHWARRLVSQATVSGQVGQFRRCGSTRWKKRKWTDQKKRGVGCRLQYLKGLADNDDDKDGVLSFNELYNYRARRLRPDKRQFPPSAGANAPPLGSAPGEGGPMVFHWRWMLVYLFGLGLYPADLVLGTKHFGVANTLITVCSAVSTT
jgi:hypothetical protein